MGSRSVFLVLLLLGVPVATAQFTLPGEASDFTVTTFAQDLNFPVGMTALPDGSLLVGVSNGTTFYSATPGRLVRLVDGDDDGIAELQQTLVESVPGASPTAVTRAGNLVFVTGQGQPIVLYRLGDAPSDPLKQVGQLTITYGGPWQHKHSALLARLAPDDPGTVELYFQVGSSENFAATTESASFTSDLGVEGTLAGDAVHRLRLTDNDETPSVLDVKQIASGLRNASGLAFHPETGDFYIAENGIDGLEDANEPLSADEINVIPADQVGGDIEDFGFPGSYVVYRTGETVGEGGGLPPALVFQPIPDPFDGAESEGPNAIAFAPATFSDALEGDLFVGFHGRFGDGGLENEENPLVLADIENGDYVHFIGVDEPGVGHLDGLFSQGTDLFVVDLGTDGRLSRPGSNTGAIYRIRHEDVLIDATEDQGRHHVVRFTAHPNPFSTTTALSLSLPGPELVRVTIYDVLGREVEVVYDGLMRGDAALQLSVGEHLARGVYFVQARGSTFRLTRRVVRVR